MLSIIIVGIFALICNGAQYSDMVAGVCTNSAIGGSPRNVSRDYEDHPEMTDAKCREKCDMVCTCIGYSVLHYNRLQPSNRSYDPLKTRCALWIDSTMSYNEILPSQEGWSTHPRSRTWVEGEYPLTSGSGHVEWECFTRVDMCSGDVEISNHPYTVESMMQGEIRGVQCKDVEEGGVGTVMVHCENGVLRAEGSCAFAAIKEPYHMLDGQGVCRDTTPADTGVRPDPVGPGISPPNWDSFGVTEFQCEHSCSVDADCIAYAFTSCAIRDGKCSMRCTNFLDISADDFVYMGTHYDVNGVEVGPGSIRVPGWDRRVIPGWVKGESHIDGVSGEAGWRCYEKVTKMTSDPFRNMGVGICQSETGGSPTNYSKNLKPTSQRKCHEECTDFENVYGHKTCMGYSFAATGRCALWIVDPYLPADVGPNLPTGSAPMEVYPDRPNGNGWEWHPASGFDQDQDHLMKASGDEPWECYIRI